MGRVRSGAGYAPNDRRRLAHDAFAVFVLSTLAAATLPAAAGSPPPSIDLPSPGAAIGRAAAAVARAAAIPVAAVASEAADAADAVAGVVDGTASAVRRFRLHESRRHEPPPPPWRPSRSTLVTAAATTAVAGAVVFSGGTPAAATGQQSSATTTVLLDPGAATTVAGTGADGDANGSGTSATFRDMEGVVAVNGSIYLSTRGAIRRIDATTGQVTTLAGVSNVTGCVNSTDPAVVRLGAQGEMATDGTHLYTADTACFPAAIRKVSLSTGATSTLATFAGTLVGALAVGGDGHLYAVTLARQLYRVDTGTGTKTYLADIDTLGGPLSMTADAAYLWIFYQYTSGPSTIPMIKRVDIATASVVNAWSAPTAEPVDDGSIVSAGDYLYVSNPKSTAVRRFAKAGMSTFVTVVGTNAAGFADGTGTDAWFGRLAGLATDGTNLWAADSTNRRVRRLSPAAPLPTAQSPLATTALDIDPGRATTFAGSGIDATVDGVGTAAALRDTKGIAVVGGYGYLLSAGALRKVDLGTGQVTTMAGHATATGYVDSSDPSAVRFGASAVESGLTTDGHYLYAAESGRIRRVSLATGATSTLVSGVSGALTFGPDGYLYAAAGVSLYRVHPASGASTTVASVATSPEDIRAVTSDATDLWVVVQSGSLSYRLRRVPFATLVATTVAETSAPGTGTPSFGIASAGPYLYTTLGRPGLRRYTKAGGAWIDIVGTSGSGHIDGDSTDAWFGSIPAVASDGTSLWVADALNRRLRKVASGSRLSRMQPAGPAYDLDVAGRPVTTVAGNGTNATVNGPLGSASFKELRGIAVHGTDVLVAGVATLRRVDLARGTVTTFAGTDAVALADSSDPAKVGFNCAHDITSDGYYLYSSCSQTRRISLATGATSSLSPGSNHVTTGPDGLLYYAFGKDLLRVDPSTGQSTIVPVGTNPPTDNPSISAVAADADSIWAVYTIHQVCCWPRYFLKRLRLSDGLATTFAEVPPGSTLASAGRYLYYAHRGIEDVREAASFQDDRAIRRFDKLSGGSVDIAGTRDAGYVDATGIAARFSRISAMASDGSTLWIADDGNRRLRAISLVDMPIPGDSAFGDDGYGAWTDDVNGAVGNFVHPTTDVQVAAPGADLAVTRTYNSRETRVGPFGIGWSFAYGMRADHLGTGVVVSFPDGRREYHKQRIDGTLAPPPGYYSTLAPAPGGGFTLTAKDRTVHVFRPDGKLTSTTDANGRATVLAYDAGGKLTTVTDAASGRALSFTWAGAFVASVSTLPVAAHGGALTWRYYYEGNKLVQACDPRNNALGGSCTVYTWTGERITRITRPKGNAEVELGYVADGRVDWRRNGAGDDLDFSYPSTGVVRATDERGNTTESTYDASHRQLSETDAALKVVTHAYDAAGNRASTTDGNNATTTFGYDERGNVVSSTDGEGKTTYFAYDGADLLRTRRDARSSGPTDARYVTSFDYDVAGNRTGETSPPTADFPDGVTKTATYTAGTEPAAGGGSMPPGLLRTETDERGKVTTHSYNAAGDRTETVDRVGLRTVWTYDELGRKLTETVHSDTFPAGATTSFTYDVLDNVVTTTGSTTGNEVTGATSRLRTTNTYDANENLKETRQEDTEILGSVRLTEYDYDLADRLIETIDAEGGVTTRTYDAAGNVIRVTDAEGRVLETAYDNRNLPETVTLKDFIDDPVAGSPPRDVVVATFTHDGARRRATERDALGRVRRVGYDKADRITSVTLLAYEQRDAATRDVVLQATSYDPAGRPLTEEAGSGLRKLVHSYDAAGRRTSTTLDPGGLDRVTTFSYDRAGNLVRRTSAGGGRTEEVRFGYDDGSRRTSQEVENGSADLVTRFGYDRRGNRLSVTSPRGHVTEHAYDELSRMVRTTLPPVVVEEAGLAAVTARPESRIGYSAFGESTHERDARGAVTTRGFDRLGRRTTVMYPAYTDADGVTLQPTESTAYDKVGNIVMSTDRRGHVTDFTFDKRNRVVRQLDPLVAGEPARGEVRTSYDEAGNRTQEVDQRGAATEWTYDDLDRVRTRTAVVRRPTGAPERHVTTFDYDDLGNKTYERDPLGHETRFEWSPASEQRKEIDPLGKEDRFSYDLAGRRTEAVDPLNRRTVTEYDLAGRPVAERRYDRDGVLSTSTLSGWDADGNHTSTTTPRGNTTTFDYDAAGRLASVVEPVATGHSISTRYGWDAVGNLTRITNGRGHTTRRTYTPWNLLESTVEPSTAAHPAPADRTWTTVYDAGGLPVQERQPGGVVVARTFDALGRPEVESGSGGGAPAASRVFDWDLGGLRRSVSHPSGAIILTWDDRRLLTAASGGAGSSSFSYDAAGRMGSRTDAAGTATFTWTPRGELATARDPLTGVTRTYGWDDASQLASVDHAPGGAARLLTWDDLGRLSSDTLRDGAGVQQVRHAYGYDDDGNMTSRTVSVPPLTPVPGSPPSNPAAGTHAFRYDDAGRLTRWTAPDGAETLYAWDDAGNRTGAAGAVSTYDERDRLVSGPDGTRTWTARGTLASLATGPLPTSSWTFDALGRLVAHDAVSYAWDGLDRLASRSAGTTAPFAYGGVELDPVSDGGASYGRSPSGDLLSVADVTGAFLAGRDRHGDLTHLFGGTGSVAATRVWDPFGNVAGTSGTWTVPAGFQSDWTDPVSGEVWMGARWYGPPTGAFHSRDTVSGVPTQPVTLNRYTYANADPLEFFDPDGHRGISLGGLLRSAGRAMGALLDGPGVAAPRFDGVARSAVALAAGTASVQGRRTQQRILPGVGLPAPEGWDRWSGKRRKDWIARNDPVIKRMKLAEPWDVKSLAEDAYRGGENGLRGMVDGASDVVTFGHGTNLGPRHRGDIYRASYSVGRVGGSAAAVIGAGGASTALAARTAAYRAVARTVGHRTASAGLGAAVGAGSEKLANRNAGARELLVAAGLGAVGGAVGARAGMRPRPPNTADDLARLPVGRRGSPMDVSRGTNSPTTIGGRQYGGHALDEMMSEGFTPSVVDDAIRYGQSSTGASDRVAFYSSSNHVTVIVENDRVVTVSSGRLKPR